MAPITLSPAELERLTITVPEAAEALQMSMARVRALVNQRQLPLVRGRAGAYRIPRRAVARFGEGYLVGADAEPWLADGRRRALRRPAPELGASTVFEARRLVPTQVAACGLCGREELLVTALKGRNKRTYLRLCERCTHALDTLAVVAGGRPQLLNLPRDLPSDTTALPGSAVSLDHLRECRPPLRPLEWPDRESLTVKEVAQVLGLSPGAVNNAIAMGELPGVFRVAHARRILWRPLQAALEHIAQGHAWEIPSWVSPFTHGPEARLQIEDPVAARSPGRHARLLLSIPETARVLSVSDSLVRTLIAEKRFPGVTRVAGRIMISCRALEQWIDRGGSASDPSPAPRRLTRRSTTRRSAAGAQARSDVR